ncbi:MerR family transcriptional regulator [Streptomyces sp. NPDC101110]|uniref:MerR family transcriptional regulator n=1 Tax=unclassified Streptomyces TaxID=2593676 RepID=UPI0037F21C78
MSYSVGQVAGFAGVTVRTLHHYDAIGLLAPSERSHAGHRRYSDADLDRLQQILFYRELGFPLEEVAALLDDPEADPRAHLRRQHELLTARIEKLRKMAAAVEHAMEARTMGLNLTPEERFEVFGDNDPEQYAEEVEQRWGDTDEYADSQRRTASYTKEDWKRIQAEAADWGERYGALMSADEPPTGEAAMTLAEEHRQHICTWFYECSYEIHRCLGETYVSDERFKAFYEALRPGLAEHLRDAIVANAARHNA